jgi:hypothetical protein
MERDMNEKPMSKRIPPFVFIIIGAVIIAAVLFFLLRPRGAATPAPEMPAVETEALLPTNTSIPPTATATALPTATQVPSPTSTPVLAIVDPGLSVWCHPADQLTAPPSSEGIAIAPEGANVSGDDGGVVLVTIPNYSCNYVFHFNQAAPQGLIIEVYDWLQKQPVFTLPALPATDNPNAAVMVSTNAYLTSPPVWEYTYRFVLRDPGGSVLWESQVRLDKGWRPNICLAGVLPNPKTLRCPLRQDAHPWDPWYAKTPVPNDDDNPIP